jgi:Tol biopolymer transport system component
VDLEKGGGGDRPVNLGWPKGTTNYEPDFSPDTRYLVYTHYEVKDTPENRSKAGRSPYWYACRQQAELYVCRWPADGVNVRITWNGGAGQPQWWAPAAKPDDSKTKEGVR